MLGAVPGFTVFSVTRLTVFQAFFGAGRSAGATTYFPTNDWAAVSEAVKRPGADALERDRWRDRRGQLGALRVLPVRSVDRVQQPGFAGGAPRSVRDARDRGDAS